MYNIFLSIRLVLHHNDSEPDPHPYCSVGSDQHVKIADRKLRY